MEKRIPFVQFQSVKSVAKAIDPYLRQKARLVAQIEGLDEEFKVKAEEELKKLKERIKVALANKKAKLEAEIESTDNQVAAIEAGIVSIVGFHVTDLVKKVIEPNDKGLKETKYVPTDIVSYDNTTKEFVVTVPDEEDPIIPPTTEGLAGSDFDLDKEQEDSSLQPEEEEETEDDLPFDAPNTNETAPWE